MPDSAALAQADLSIAMDVAKMGYEQDFDVQTVSGWIMELLERIPQAGDTVDYRNMHLTVESMKEKRVDTVRLEIRPESQSA